MARKRKISGVGILMGVAAVTAVISLCFLGAQSTFDTFSYIHEWDLMTQGNFPLERTPGYPFFLAMCRLIGGSSGMLWVAAILQWIVFIAVIPLAWETIRMLGCSAKITFFILMAGLCCCAEIWIFNNAANPESLCLSGLIVYCWSVIRMFRNIRPWISAVLLADIVWLLALRPAMVYILPVMALLAFVMLFRRKHLKIWAATLAGTILISAGYVCYCRQVYKQTGVFTPTIVSIVNDWAVSRGAKIVDGSLFPRDRLGKEMHWWVNECRDDYTPGEMSRELQYQAAEELERYISESGLKGYGEVARVLRGSRKDHPAEYMAGFIARFKASANHVFGLSNLTTAYIFLFIYLGVLLWQWKKRGAFPWYGTLLWILAVAHLLIPLLAAMNSWDRLDFPAWPLFLLMTATLFSGKRHSLRH